MLSKAVLAEKQVISVSIESLPHGNGALLAIEVGEGARTEIEKMSKENVSKSVAVVSKGRVLSLPVITQPYSDSRILMTTSTMADAEEVAAALR